MSYSKNDLIRDISRLMSQEPVNKPQLKQWYVEAKHVQQMICSEPELANVVPEIVWHYLIDADIRLKDLDYAAEQRAILLEALDKL